MPGIDCWNIKGSYLPKSTNDLIINHYHRQTQQYSITALWRYVSSHMTIVPTDRYKHNLVKSFKWTQNGSFEGGFYLYFAGYNYNDESQQHFFFGHEAVGHDSGDYQDLAEFWKKEDQGVYDWLMSGIKVSRMCLWA